MSATCDHNVNHRKGAYVVGMVATITFDDGCVETHRTIEVMLHLPDEVARLTRERDEARQLSLKDGAAWVKERTEVERLTAERDMFSMALTIMSEDVDRRADEVARLTEANEVLTEERNDWTDRAQALAAQRDDLREANEALTAERDGLVSHCEALISDHNAIDDQADALREANDRLTKALRERDRVLAQCRIAFEHTREYVAPAVALPAIEGWSWFDAVTAIDALLAGAAPVQETEHAEMVKRAGDLGARMRAGYDEQARAVQETTPAEPPPSEIGKAVWDAMVPYGVFVGDYDGTGRAASPREEQPT